MWLTSQYQPSHRMPRHTQGMMNSWVSSGWLEAEPGAPMQAHRRSVDGGSRNDTQALLPFALAQLSAFCPCLALQCMTPSPPLTYTGSQRWGS